MYERKFGAGYLVFQLWRIAGSMARYIHFSLIQRCFQLDWVAPKIAIAIDMNKEKWRQTAIRLPYSRCLTPVAFMA